MSIDDLNPQSGSYLKREKAFSLRYRISQMGSQALGAKHV